ncbi:MAG: AAA family ATPase [Dehalococcoidales bacterium]|nr:AAA family ATPase [Dehalococcoidales bacterium]
MWNIIGQERAVSLLKHGLESNRLSHAYLFIGPPHVGKMTLALSLAQALNCETEDRPCLECDSCRKIAAGSHSDVQVIGLDYNEDEDAERKQIRNVQIDGILHDASLPPFEGKNKVFIIDGAELMSAGAANRLLKTLEEPEANVTFILLATDENRLMQTIVSRCQRIELQPMSIAEETQALTEKSGIEPEQARLLAGLSHGCPGWAINAASDPRIMEQRGSELDQIIGVIRGNYEERFAYVFRLAAGFTQNRQAVYDTLDRWQDWWRDMLLVKLDCDNMITNIDRKEELANMSKNYNLSSIRNFIQSIDAAGLQLKQNVNQRLALEVLMLDIPREEAKVSPI